jgi:hypothetical protein
MKTNLTGVGELQKEGVGSGDVIFPQGQVGGMRHNHPSHLYFGYERDSGGTLSDVRGSPLFERSGHRESGPIGF